LLLALQEIKRKIVDGTIDGGLWYFDEVTNKVVQVKTDNLKPESFYHNEIVYFITIDNKGAFGLDQTEALIYSILLINAFIRWQFRLTNKRHCFIYQ
jgi:hypothetical protein